VLSALKSIPSRWHKRREPEVVIQRHFYHCQSSWRVSRRAVIWTSMSPSTSRGARQARGLAWVSSSLLTTAQKLATSREAGRRVEGLLRAVAGTYDQVFDTPFPYSMGLHPAPCDRNQHPEWQFHAHLSSFAFGDDSQVYGEIWAIRRPSAGHHSEFAAETLRRAKARISASKSISL